MLNSHRDRLIFFIFKGQLFHGSRMNPMNPDKVPLVFGIKIDPHHHMPFTIPRDWHGFISVNLIAVLICIER